jgi:hypothetical protein
MGSCTRRKELEVSRPKLTFSVNADTDRTCIHVDLNRPMDRFETLAICSTIEAALISQLRMKPTTSAGTPRQTPKPLAKFSLPSPATTCYHQPQGAYTMSDFFKPQPHRSEQKVAIITASAETDDNLVIDAKAGSGKTSTLLDLLPALRGSILFSAFNKSISDEIGRKVNNLGHLHRPTHRGADHAQPRPSKPSTTAA